MPGESRRYFEGRKLVIATMHGKEKVIAPLLQEALGVEVLIAENLNTDQFGTFSGEIKRETDPLEAARLKCRLACRQNNCSLAIASEGSFGPHPTLFFVPADDEIVLLMDLENDLEIKARELSTKTNFSHATVYSVADARDFAASVLFPEHALILREQEGSTQNINSWETLEKLTEEYLHLYGQVFLETDMRAMHNPTRMAVIEEATKKLIAKIANACPSCGLPGFDVAEMIDGLPCSQCGSPTRSILSLIYECQKCRYKKEEKYPRGKTNEEPMYCDWCNP